MIDLTNEPDVLDQDVNRGLPMLIDLTNEPDILDQDVSSGLPITDTFRGKRESHPMVIVLTNSNPLAC